MLPGELWNSFALRNVILYDTNIKGRFLNRPKIASRTLGRRRPMGVTQIELTEEEERGLRQLAERRQATVAAIVHELIRAGLRREEPIDREELKRRFLASAGSFHSGFNDISERHDDYLEESYLS
jgi:hypothetical protein